jgi:hypothetical protein
VCEGVGHLSGQELHSCPAVLQGAAQPARAKFFAQVGLFSSCMVCGMILCNGSMLLGGFGCSSWPTRARACWLRWDFLHSEHAGVPTISL